MAVNILIIQDSPLINMMLKSRLEGHDFLTESVETAEEGIQKTLENKYDIILLDYKLPGMNGKDACKLIKNNEKTSGIPILFLSGQDEKELKILVQESGAEGYISLPFNAEDLLAKINDCIKQK